VDPLAAICARVGVNTKRNGKPHVGEFILHVQVTQARKHTIRGRAQEGGEHRLRFSEFLSKMKSKVMQHSEIATAGASVLRDRTAEQNGEVYEVWLIDAHNCASLVDNFVQSAPMGLGTLS
jgi:hypothetical protein